MIATLAAAGTVGEGRGDFLDLDFAPPNGRTRLVRAAMGPPLAVKNVLYIDEALPDMAVAFLVNSTAGILQGGRLRITIRARSGARVLLTTQSATKVFSMPTGEASQRNSCGGGTR